jgi:DNA topoisomerase VI subunit B
MTKTPKLASASAATLHRKHFETSRALDFLSRKELIAQTGHRVDEWPLVCLKELVDNALDACEEAGVAPAISITVDESSICVVDNGPGIPLSVVNSVLDFNVRVSSREAYVSPCRGAQGNALKTLVAMPFALCGAGSVVIESQGVRHDIAVSVDRIKQQPRIIHRTSTSEITEGTKITVLWLNEKPSLIVGNEDSRFLQNGNWANEKPSLILLNSKARFLQIAEDYCWVNPHLTMAVDWVRNDFTTDRITIAASDPAWAKWSPSQPTDPNWYGVSELERLIAANICHEDRLVREFVAEFRGLSGTAKQKAVLESTSLGRSRLSDLIADDGGIDKTVVSKLLDAMKAAAKPVKPPALGIIGKEHFMHRCELAGGDPKTFNYKKIVGVDNGLPWVIETCFAYCPKELKSRRIIADVNWSPGINNPFRQLGSYGVSLDSVLHEQRSGRDEPIVLVLHIACPKVSYADRGKSSVIVEG